MNKIYLADNLTVLKKLKDASVDLVYIDPPFNTGKVQKRTRIKAAQNTKGDRVGFGDRRYSATKLTNINPQYGDNREDYFDWLTLIVLELSRVMKPEASLFLHLDYRSVHRAKCDVLDTVFGENCFQNEIVWIYDFGGRSKKKWSAKHDNILWYTKHPTKYTFNYEAIDRIPYLAPGLVGKEKAKRGKTPTTAWWNTIVPTNGKEKTGYPTQKPLNIVERIVRVHSSPGDVVLDCFAGSGTLGEAAGILGRAFILVDNNQDAVKIMAKRLKSYKPKCIGFKR